jgi:deoxyribodipyrimidine photo-lyase
MLGCLEELRDALRDRGSNLVIRRGKPEKELVELARETHASAVHFASDVSPFAMARDRRVEEALRQADVEPVRHPGNFVADVGKPETQGGKPFSVFSPFHRAWQKLPRREIHGAPRSLTLPSDVAVGEIPHAEPGLEEPMPPGEKAGRARMHAWIRDGLADYGDNHDRLEGGTSELSPYLHFGCVSPRELEEKAAASPEYTRQLCWRDFYAHVLLNHPRNARHAHQERMDGLEWEDDEEGFEAWCEGRTGFPVVDAGMRELRARGWMHNRARLVVGSFLTKDLGIDWRLGERWFMRHLVDGDEANNNGNWQWVSSVGVDPAPYFRRMYNPATQQERHDPTGEYVRRWVPELESGDYPEPIVDHKRERERAMARYRAVRG